MLKKYLFACCMATTMLFADPISDQIEAAREKGEHTFVLFYKSEDGKVQDMDREIKALMDHHPDICMIRCDITKGECTDVVKQFDLKRAPMPIVIAVAPNGAVTGGMPLTVTQEKLENCLISPGMQQVMKGLQEKKLIVLCLRNANMPDCNVADQGVIQFSNDPGYRHATLVVNVDPEDPKEKKLLDQFQLSSAMSNAKTLIIAPPGDVVATFDGGTSKDQFVNKLKSASSPCCPGGCCPGGCCPGGKCG